MGNTSSERAGLERHGHKASRGDGAGGAGSTKDGDRPKILMDSPEDADLFHPEEMKVWLLLPWERWGCLRAFPVQPPCPIFLPTLNAHAATQVVSCVIFRIKRSLGCLFGSL